MNNRAFTILEVIAAIFVMTVGVLGAYAVVQQIIVYTSISSSRLTAAYLAQEGIELVRNIRDSNWLQGAGNWTNGIASDSDWVVHPTLSKFKTKKTITPVGSDEIKVVVEVTWTEKGQTHTVTVQENLYDWK